MIFTRCTIQKILEQIKRLQVSSVPRELAEAKYSLEKSDFRRNAIKNSVSSPHKMTNWQLSIDKAPL